MFIEIPKEIITNTDNRSVVLTPELVVAIPDIDEAFKQVDKKFLDNPENYLSNIEDSVFTFHSSEGEDVACSLLYGPMSKPDELLVIFAPFSDTAPKSQSSDIYGFVTSNIKNGLFVKEKASPNSWSQSTKSAVIFELLEALGKGMPVLTIYSPISTGAFSTLERKSIKNGDFTPVARITLEAIAAAQDRLHGPKSETQIDKHNISGASLGSSNGIGAAEGLVRNGREVYTVTAQELILGPKNLRNLGKRFTTHGIVGAASEENYSRDYPIIQEPAIRRTIDKKGSELFGTYSRVVKAMKPVYMKGLTKPEAIVRSVEYLLDNNVNLLAAIAENDAMSYQTRDYLPEGVDVVNLRGEKGQKLGHIVDEHVALSALVVALNVMRGKG
ncbi:MAG TPA: hypothetical protein VMR51_01180 [Patescibacteria group bacterium]|nr:hypothetical protein [Patescibacteria group bacterium]